MNFWILLKLKTKTKEMLTKLIINQNQTLKPNFKVTTKRQKVRLTPNKHTLDNKTKKYFPLKIDLNMTHGSNMNRYDLLGELCECVNFFERTQNEIFTIFIWQQPNEEEICEKKWGNTINWMEEKLYEHAQTSTLTSRYLGFVGNLCTFTLIFPPQRIFSQFTFCYNFVIVKATNLLQTCFGEYVHYFTENVCIFHHYCKRKQWYQFYLRIKEIMLE